MKSSAIQLESRGFVTEEKLKQYRKLSIDQIGILLNSKIATERSIAAKIISEKNLSDFLPHVVEVLKTEKKLYTKLSLCETLQKFGTLSLQYLIPLLGKIGINQHKAICLPDLKKKSFPLPRDIVARTIIRIGPAALPLLREVIHSGEYIQKTEAIDAIGHISINNSDDSSEDFLLTILNTTSDELIRWKIVRALQAFSSNRTIAILEKAKNESICEILKAEACRSLQRILQRTA